MPDRHPPGNQPLLFIRHDELLGVAHSKDAGLWWSDNRTGPRNAVRAEVGHGDGAALWRQAEKKAKIKAPAHTHKSRKERKSML